MNDLREAACEYALKGWFVFPLKPRSKKPDGFLVPDGMKQASKNPSDCLYWWSRQPNANIGINCQASGLVVIDVDERHAGFDTLHELELELGALPTTLTQWTPTRGEHIVFENPGGDFAKMLGEGVDIKSDGYIVGAPSRHPAGGEYQWSTEAPIVPLPERWLEAMRPKGGTAPRQRPSEARIRPSAASDDPLLNIEAQEYAERLTGREVQSGWMQCPFHREGRERTPSFKVDGTKWACFGCEPPRGKQSMGGNIYDLAGMLWNLPVPLDKQDIRELKDRLKGVFREG